MATENKSDIKDISVEEKLKALYDLQIVDSEIDRIKILRGELPLEVQDLEDEIGGMKTRIENYQTDVKTLEANIRGKNEEIQRSQALLERYKEQQNNVRNNKEYDNLSKEIEYQNLEIELSEKRIREYTAAVKIKKEEIERLDAYVKDRKIDLKQKRAELNEIVSETKQEEENLKEQAQKIESKIDPLLLTAFKRIRKNARNGLAIVSVQRDACGGCFNRIPPQRQMDIRLRKKIIVCEYCGRVLVDPELAGIIQTEEV